ncbi:CooT family nickel-binding protein [Candidatus Bipolaricaulota bacterium]|nr:CooT family nickel-binding protein [Candidatus Bipolaricaulota bacterium]MCK4598287.1 CooT family nickel-binding protein [Candidatus Bipolaricaulota bacterium]
MCLASVQKGKGTEKENLLEEVALIRFEGEKLLVRTLFGEERAIKAKIKEIDFMNSTVLIEED